RYPDESVRFGSDAVGGIRVSHMSDLPGGKPFEVRLTSSRGKRSLVRVKPLPDAAPMSPVEKLRAEYKTANPERREAILAEVAALQADAATPADTTTAAGA